MPSKRKGNWRARGTNAANTPRPPRAQDAPALVDDIADLGDIILVVGIEEKQRQLRVLSHMLRAASKTFAVMFGPVFQEGQGLDVNNPKSIPLPEDDAEAMEVLCRIIHLHNDSVSMTMSAEKVLSIARLVDKYALHRTVYLAATYWLDPTSTTDIKALGQLLVAADLMDHHRGFRNITENMVTRHTACFHHITSYHCEDDIWSRLYLLEDNRARVRRGLEHKLLVLTRSSYRIDGCDCRFREVIRNHLEEKVFDQMALREAHENNIAYILAQVAAIPEPDSYQARMYERCQAHPVSHAAFLAEHVQEVMTQQPTGLCLTCTRAGELTDHEEDDDCSARC